MPLSAITHTFAGNPLDRASDRRSDAEWLAERLSAPGSTALAMWNGKPLLADTADGLAIARLTGDMARELAGSEERLLFLGLSEAGAVFAVDMDGTADPAEGPLEGLGYFADLRAAAANLPAEQSGMLATARSLFEWRRRHRFCAACGQPSRVADGGWRRICTVCDTQHFPRVDPCVIMLPIFGDRCLVGRQAAWPAGRFSALAGFLEPGESIEEACAREVKEEAGLTVTGVRYHSSQPWPYPSQLMIGLLAEVSDDDAAPDQTELEAVRWLTREQARALTEGRLEDISSAPPTAIAHHLIKAWAYD